MNETILEDPDGRLAYGIAEFAAKMNLSHRTIVNLVSAGELATIRVGKRRLIPAAAAADFIRKRWDTTGAPTKEPPPNIQRKQKAAREREAAAGKRAEAMA